MRPLELSDAHRKWCDIFAEIYIIIKTKSREAGFKE